MEKPSDDKDEVPVEKDDASPPAEGNDVPLEGGIEGGLSGLDHPTSGGQTKESGVAEEIGFDSSGQKSQGEAQGLSQQLSQLSAQQQQLLQQQILMNGMMQGGFGSPMGFNPQMAMLQAGQFGMMNPFFAMGNPFFMNPRNVNNEEFAKAQRQFLSAQNSQNAMPTPFARGGMLNAAATGLFPLPGMQRLSNNEEILESLGAQSLERRQKKIAYFDASTLPDPHTPVSSRRNSRGGVTESFPTKLYRMLDEAEEEGHDGIVSFLGHGRAFCIHKPDSFAKIVMPRYFKQSRVSSFQRQLNLYGFTRINTGPDAGAYYHELFLRGRPALHTYIRRAGIPQAQPRRRGVKAHDSTLDPNFYILPPIAKPEQASPTPKKDK